MKVPFFEGIERTTPIVMCVHCVDDPSELKFIYRSAAGKITFMCDIDHDMNTELNNFRWAHAGHIAEKFPAVSTLVDLPPDHVAMLYYDDGPKWVVEVLLDGDAQE